MTFLKKAVMHQVDVKSVNILSNRRRFQKSGEKSPSPMRNDKFLSKHLKRTLEKAGAIIASPLSPHDKSLMRTDPQNLKEMAPAKRLAIQGATHMLKQAKKSGKNFESSLTKMGHELVVYESEDVSFFTAICTLFPQLCEPDSPNPGLDLKSK